MPIVDLIKALGEKPPHTIRSLATDLPYRDHLLVGLLVKKTCPESNLIPDHWIYIQDKQLHLARITTTNNWSPALVLQPETICLGLEYFCNEGDQLWSMTNDEVISMASVELKKIGLINSFQVLDGTVVRSRKAYLPTLALMIGFMKSGNILNHFQIYF